MCSISRFLTVRHSHFFYRSIKKGVFLVLRQTLYTVQATVFVGGNVGRPMVQYAAEVSKESVIDVRGKLVTTPSPVSGCTQKEVELKIDEVREGTVVWERLRRREGRGRVDSPAVG